MNQTSWQTRDLAHIWHPCSQMKDYEDFPPIIIDRGEGVRLFDLDGKEYLDIISSWWCNTLGHCNPRIAEAIKHQVDKLDHVLFANFSHEGVIQLAERLADITPEGLDKFCFSDNGSTSVECALKMSFQYHLQTGHPEKQRFMCLSDGYHGETLGALSVCADSMYAGLYAPLMHDSHVVRAPDCYRCPYGCTRKTCTCPCFEHAERLFEQKAYETCAIIVEPLLQGSAGMRMYPPLYLEKLRALCDEHHVHLIADEVATGFGRTGTMFAFDQTSVVPDLLCTSKNLTGGFLPMAVTAVTEEIYRAFYADYSEGKAFMHSHTYSGNPIAAAAALAVQDALREDDLVKHASTMGNYANQLLSEAFSDHPHIGEIRQLGPINAMELVVNRATKEGFASRDRIGYHLYRQALDRGLMLRPLGNVVYFNPALTITRQEVELAVERTIDALEAVLDR
ncbi:MAG: adenosylmethionine--8-amino-7-oxononanoate transaminase [Gordonibacter sp.]|nr:adenosylmethionine--8-amino-7-oxononanoate transaminase [Gordonibacter sp.]